MQGYLNDIEHAATSVLKEIWREERELTLLQINLKRLKGRVQQDYQRAQSMMDDGETADDVMLGVGLHWDTYFGDDKKAYHMSENAEILGRRIQIHEFSRASLAGNLLQYAKQGISIVHQGPTNCPAGRTISGESLKNVIWQGRNQTMHYEEGRLNQPIISCFENLDRAFPGRFAAFRTQNMAFEIIKLLEWKDWAAFKKDMEELS